MIACKRCGALHAGQYMRTDPRYSRVKRLLAEVPHTDAGQISFCRSCQRSVYFANGLVKLLIKDIREATRFCGLTAA